ncbi:MAG: hypothetical protein PVF46_02300 [Lysobacterales bacterium]|jgi:hypothetical protein
MKLIARSLLLIVTALLVAGCPQTKEEKGLSETLSQYETFVRWAEWDAAVGFVAPEYLEEHPITRLDMDRLRLFKVTQYQVRSSAPVDGGDGLLQTVEIRMFNKHQARERAIIDEQYWKYDPVIERWQLHSGLPDPTQGR